MNINKEDINKMDPWMILVIVLVVGIVLIGALAFAGNKLQKKQNAAEEQMRQAAQQVSMLIIDKKKMKFKDAGLPKIVMEQTPKYLRGSKVPIVKAKIGPQIINLMCDAKIFDQIPVKKEVKAVVSGIYIVEVKGLRTGLEKKKTKEEIKKEKKETKKAAKQEAKKVKEKVNKKMK